MGQMTYDPSAIDRLIIAIIRRAVQDAMSNEIGYSILASVWLSCSGRDWVDCLGGDCKALDEYLAEGCNPLP